MSPHRWNAPPCVCVGGGGICVCLGGGWLFLQLHLPVCVGGGGGGTWKGQCLTVWMLLSPKLDLDDVFRGVQQVQGILHGQALCPDVVDCQDSVSGLYRATSTGNIPSLSYYHFINRGHSNFTISELVL